MGSRGKIRRRANGQLASGRARPPVQRAPRQLSPLMVDWQENPIPPVSPSELAQAITIRNRLVPIHLTDLQKLEEEESFDHMDDREKQVEKEIENALGGGVAIAASMRALLLSELLTREDPLYYEIREDGLVEVQTELLAHAASSELSDHPDERISWPNPTAP